VAEYRFLTTWLLDAPRERVWDAIHDQKSWPSWWRGVVDVVEHDPGDEQALGSRARITWRSRRPSELVVETHTTRVERPHLLAGEAEGELAGNGTWRFYEQDGITAATYEWNVRTTKPWMNLLAPVARPVFAWNHDWLMKQGGAGIAELLGCRLVAGA
jgi:uncharacterized protein YndB with AHSA1/START domain